MKAFSRSISLFTKLVMAAAYLTFEHESGAIQRTGIKREIQWNQSSDPVPLSREIELIRRKVLIRPGELGPLSVSRQLELELECHALGVTPQQGHCLRRQLLVKKALSNGCKLQKKGWLKYVTHEFENGRQTTLLDMAREMDIPPVQIFRAILWSRLAREHNIQYKKERKRIIKSLLYEDNKEHIDEYLAHREYVQLEAAKKNDIVGYAGLNNNSLPQLWETEVMNYLDELGVNYLSEDILRESDERSTSHLTPDCLVLDDLHINNHPIHWIEIKSFFASGLRKNKYTQRKTLVNQVERYNREFGSGAVVLKNGFSDTIKLENILLLDSGPLDSNILMP